MGASSSSEAERDQADADALVAAAARGDCEHVRANLHNMNARDWAGDYALIAAASHCQESVCALLLSVDGIQVDCKDSENATPLLHASRVGHEGIVRLLLAKKAKLKSRSTDRWGAMHYAAAEGHTHVLAVLKAAGADATVGGRDGVDSSGQTCLHLAAHEGHAETCRFLLAECPGNDPLAEDESGDTAAALAEEPSLREMLEKAADGAAAAAGEHASAADAEAAQLLPDGAAEGAAGGIFSGSGASSSSNDTLKQRRQR